MPAKKQMHRFEIFDCPAEAAFIAGSFNGWHPASSGMKHCGNGHWIADLPLAPGIHEYLFVVDNIWLPDPRANEVRPNPYGGINSVVRIAQPECLEVVI